MPPRRMIVIPDRYGFEVRSVKAPTVSIWVSSRAVLTRGLLPALSGRTRSDLSAPASNSSDVNFLGSAAGRCQMRVIYSIDQPFLFGSA